MQDGFLYGISLPGEGTMCTLCVRVANTRVETGLGCMPQEAVMGGGFMLDMQVPN